MSKMIGSAEIFDKTVDHSQLLDGMQNMVHMYQNDIDGINAIDNAFANNSIFCIKAFVDNLLQLTDEMHFRNCFDKALIIMIRKGLDVKDLVNSTLFYPPIWTN